MSETTLQENSDPRTEIKRIMGETGLPATTIAREAGVGYSTFTAWFNGTYRGDNEAVVASARRWIDGRRDRAETKAVMPVAPGFQTTPTAEKFLGVLRHAQFTPDLVAITSDPGLGKTMSCRAYQRSYPNVWHMTAEPAFGSPRAVLAALASAMGITERLAGQRLSHAVIQKARNSGGLIIVDEAQHLSSLALDQLRTLHDLAEIGVAVVGNEMIYSRLEGDGRKAQFAQMFSRVGMRIGVRRAQNADIEVLLDAWEIAGVSERKLLHVIAGKAGALRGMTKCLRIAGMLAQTNNRPIDAEMIRTAWQQISSTKIEVV
jgi:DNA transposition AAA+ family ATPase